MATNKVPRRCLELGTLIYESTKEGYGCPKHSYIEKGLTPQQVVGRMRVNSDYPHGGYCCSDCHHLGNPVDNR